MPPAQFMRFLFRWQRVAMEGRDDRREGEAGLLAVLRELEGFAVPAGAWERDILPLRVKNYVPQDLDKLCAAGRIAWYRPVETSASEIAPASGPVRRTPITLVEREALAHWQKRSGTFGFRRGLLVARAEDPGKPAASMAPRSSTTSCTTPDCCGPTSSRASASWSAAGG